MSHQDNFQVHPKVEGVNGWQLHGEHAWWAGPSLPRWTSESQEMGDQHIPLSWSFCSARSVRPLRMWGTLEWLLGVPWGNGGTLEQLHGG